MQWTAPGGNELADGDQIRQVQPTDRHPRATLGSDGVSNHASRLHIAHRERDLGSRAGQYSRGLDTDTGRSPSHDDAPPGEINTRDHIRSGGTEPEICIDTL